MTVEAGIKEVIVVTDGDATARRVLERVAGNVGGRCISLSAGNPTDVTGDRLVDAIKEAKGNPVLVMVDDGGKRGAGPGERALSAIADDPAIRVIGAIAVASDTSRVEGVEVAASVDREGRIIPSQAVDKNGLPRTSDRISGDTVDVLNRLHVPVVIGLGDLGKMDDADRVEAGAEITTRAVREILRRAGRRG
ncbi:MAG: stage V sporulation protein AE [Patescibacteria group bacterium]